MKKFFAIALIGLLLSSCASDNTPSDSVQYYPVKIDESDLWGLIDNKGNLLVDNEFSNMPSAVIDGIFTVEENNEISIYEASDKPKCIVSGLKSAGYVSDGLIAVVKPESRIEFIDKKGKSKFTLSPIHNKEIISCSKSVSDGLIIIVNEEKKFGAVDTKGETVIEPKYDFLSSFSDGLSIAATNKDDVIKYTIVDKKGKEIAKIRKDIEIYSGYSYGLAVACKKSDDTKLWGFVDKKGEFSKLSKKAESIMWYNDKFVIFSNKDNDMGMMTHDGDVIVRAKYNTLSPVHNGEMFVGQLKDNKYDILNDKGDLIKTIEYDRLKILDGIGFYFAAREGDYYVLLDKDCNQVGKTEFQYIDTDYTLGFSEVITSDYYPTENIANAIVNMVSANGLGKYKLGETAEKILQGKSPDDYKYSSTVTDSDLFESNPYYYGYATLRFNGPITQSIYNPSIGYYGSFEYNWYPSQLNEITLRISVNDGKEEDLMKEICKLLPRKGWKSTITDGDTKKFTSGDTKLSVTQKSSAIELTIHKDMAMPQEEAPAVEYVSKDDDIDAFGN